MSLLLELKDIEAIWQQYPEDFSSFGPVKDDVISGAEEILGYSFPPDYRLFLSRHGFIDFAGNEYMGLSTRPYEDRSPELIWTNKPLHTLGGLPKHFIGVMSYGDGAYAVLNLMPNEEGKIYLWSPESGVNEEEPLANNFMNFLKSDTLIGVASLEE